MVDIEVQSNPFVLNGSQDDALFVGRKALFDDLRFLLNESDGKSSKPIVLYGPEQIGKTAVIQQIRNGRLDAPYYPIYIDLNEITLDSDSSFYWDLAHKVKMHANKKQTATLKSFKQTTFIAAPLQAFYLQLVKPLADALKDQKLLLLFDNLNTLTNQIHEGKISPNLIIDLHNELRQANNAASIFALSIPDTTLQAFSDLPFSQWVHGIYINALTEQEVYDLVKQPMGVTIVDAVTSYIYNLTNGHPANTKKICQDIFDYQQKNGLKHITVADIIALHKQKYENGGEITPLPKYTIQAHPNLKETINPVSHIPPWQKQPLYLIPITVALLAIIGIIVPTLYSQQNQQATDQNPSLMLTTVTPISTAIAVSENELEVDSEPNIQPETITPSPTQAKPTTTPSLTPTAALTPTAIATNTPAAMPQSFIREQDGMEMVLIPGDTFLMGSEDDNVLSAIDEQPQREVTLDEFYIDKYEINVEQFAAFLNRLGGYRRACENVDCTLPRNLAGYTNYLEEQDLGDGTIQYSPMTGFASYPANHISWYGAQSYCQSVGARLPTEAEWEYAARGTDGRLYPWGNKAPDDTLAVFQSESFDNMKAVDALPEGASPFGIFGMAGSLWEWTADWYDETYYLEAPSSNPQGPETGFARVVRGGAWPYNNQSDRIRTSNRYSLSPDFISSTVGFRCVRDP
jgi:sulfatase modifying factor 1